MFLLLVASAMNSPPIVFLSPRLSAVENFAGCSAKPEGNRGIQTTFVSLSFFFLFFLKICRALEISFHRSSRAFACTLGDEDGAVACEIGEIHGVKVARPRRLTTISFELNFEIKASNLREKGKEETNEEMKDPKCRFRGYRIPCRLKKSPDGSCKIFGEFEGNSTVTIKFTLR